MARTRGAATGVTHDDDGELLDREGKPINPIAHHGAAPTDVAHVEPPAPVEPEAQFQIVHLIDKTSIRRDCDAWELAQILELIMGEWSVRVPDAEFMRLAPDVRRHARRVREPISE